MKQQISECMDGELDQHAASRIFGRLADSAEFRADWLVYHTIGDGLRGAPDLSPAFLARLSGRLAEEPTVLSPHPIVPARAIQIAMYAAASLSAVAVVVWFALNSQPSATAPQLAQQTATAVAAARVTPKQPAISPLNPRDHDYLLAHQAVSPSSTMQGVAPYVRTVSFGIDANAR